MRIEIEVYKKHTIYYNDDSDKFECEIELNGEVKSTKRLSLKDVRKEIDLFIKANIEFKPFKFFNVETYSRDIVTYICTAIRTDGKFVVSRLADEGRYKMYYDYEDMKKKVKFYDAEIVSKIENIEKEYHEAQQKYDDSIRKLKSKLTPIDVSIYKI